MSNRALAQLLIAALERNIPADFVATLRRGELPSQDVLVQWLLFALLLRFEDVVEEKEPLRDFIKNEFRAIRRCVKASAKNVVTEMTTAKMSDYEKYGPRGDGRKKLVKEVVARLSEYSVNKLLLPIPLQDKQPSKWIHQACIDVWVDLKHGYPSPTALYNFCKSNDTKILSLAGL